MKYYYQILISLKKNKSDLVFWIRDEKIPYQNQSELSDYVIRNCSQIKNYKHINNVLVVEIDENKYCSFIKTYKDQHTELDFIIVDDTIN